MKKSFTLALALLFALSSYTQNFGVLNPNFGTNGTFSFDPSNTQDAMVKVLVQENGKILTVGKTRANDNNYVMYASRHNSDGSLDATFKDGGVTEFPYLYNAFDAVLDNKGHLFIAGYTFNNPNTYGAIVCLDENGLEHIYFGNNGYVFSEQGHGIVYHGIDIDSENRIVVCGYIDDQILVRRYNADGSADSSFGEDGSVIIVLDSHPWAWSYAFDIKALEDGKLLVAGHKDPSDMIYESYLLRLNSDGSLDETFADNGVLYLNAGEYREYAVAIDILPDGRYLIGGHNDLKSNTPNLVRSEAYLACVTTEGSLDKTFGTDGFVKFELLSGEGCTNTTASILTTSHGQIFGTIYSQNNITTASRAYVYNLDINGQPKENFAGSGFMPLPKIEDEEVMIRTSSLALKDDSNILVGGYYTTDNTYTQKLFIQCINIESYESVSELSSSTLLFPNPANDKLHIITEVEIEDALVYDVFGRQHDSKTTKQQNEITIDVAELNNGVYFVMIKTNEGVVTKRFVKN